MQRKFTFGLACLWIVIGGTPLSAKTVIDEWSSVQSPPVPALTEVQVEPSTTALLLLDFVPQTCSMARRPRCIPSIPVVSALATNAREHGVRVIYSIVNVAKPDEILPALRPHAGEVIVQSGPDKFLNTNLATVLRDDGIKTVIITGTASEGVILSTGSEAAFRGYQVIVPVDGVSSASLYAEQYVLWDLLHSPGTVGHVVITKASMIDFGH
jgi:nicotinamidase-related amidase